MYGNFYTFPQNSDTYAMFLLAVVGSLRSEYLQWQLMTKLYYQFILVINQLDAQNLFYNKFISCLYTFRAHGARNVHGHEINLL